MVGAGKGQGVAPVGLADAHAAMPARIQVSVNGVVGSFGDKYGLCPHIRGEEVPRSRQLALMTEIEPRAREDGREFALIDVTIDENPWADEPTILIDEGLGVGLRVVCHPSTSLGSSQPLCLL